MPYGLLIFFLVVVTAARMSAGKEVTASYAHLVIDMGTKTKITIIFTLPATVRFRFK
jgi:hypothetical protein